MKSLIVKIIGLSCMLFLIVSFLIKIGTEKKALKKQIAGLESERTELIRTIHNINNVSPIDRILSLAQEEVKGYKKINFNVIKI